MARSRNMVGAQKRSKKKKNEIKWKSIKLNTGGSKRDVSSLGVSVSLFFFFFFFISVYVFIAWGGWEQEQQPCK